MINPLFINRSYLFDRSPGGECLRTFVRSLDNTIFNPTIYCSDRTPLVSADNDNVKITNESSYVRYIAGIVRRILPDLTFLPGYEWYSWGIRSRNTILRDIQNGSEFDYIHSVSFPCASHKVALEVKKKTGLPWIAQLYDPWADNPYRRFKTNFLKKLDWAQERECVENADIIIHNNHTIAELWAQRYGEQLAKKIVVLPLTIPNPDIKVGVNKHKTGEVLTISHIGNFMLNRTSESFINAVAQLLLAHPEYRDLIKVNYIGNVTKEEKSLINEKNLVDIFNLVGSISAEACIQYYQESDIFMAIDGVNNNNLFFPSKILKYFYFKRPILGITPKGSVLDGELKRSKHTSISNDNITGMVDYLQKAMSSYGSLLDYNDNYWKHFDKGCVCDNYKELVLKLVTK